MHFEVPNSVKSFEIEDVYIAKGATITGKTGKNAVLPKSGGYIII